MNLRKFFQKNIRVTFTNGVTTTGFVETYTPAIDTDEELYDEIGIIDSQDYPYFLGVGAEEIKNIEIIND